MLSRADPKQVLSSCHGFCGSTHGSLRPYFHKTPFAGNSVSVQKHALRGCWVWADQPWTCSGLPQNWQVGPFSVFCLQQLAARTISHWAGGLMPSLARAGETHWNLSAPQTQGTGTATAVTEKTHTDFCNARSSRKLFLFFLNNYGGPFCRYQFLGLIHYKPVMCHRGCQPFLLLIAYSEH